MENASSEEEEEELREAGEESGGDGEDGDGMEISATTDRELVGEEDEDELEEEGDEEEQEDANEDENEEPRTPLHIEVRLLPTSTIRYDLIRRMLHTHLDSTYDTLVPHAEVQDWREVGVLSREVERVWIGECALPTPTVALTLISLQIHIYQPTPSGSSSNTTLTSSPTDGDEEDGDGGVAAATIAQLPNEELEGVWDSLVFEGGIKEGLLGYIYSTILFGDAAVNFNIVTWNRVVLLHGPPGTGKTSLCRALAQKLSIRLSDRYDHLQLVEINSHSLFSKWFSESGKLVQKLFSSINEMVEDQGTFVVVLIGELSFEAFPAFELLTFGLRTNELTPVRDLIDEVESLTAARAGAMSGKEPSDALRVCFVPTSSASHSYPSN
ncbi:pachytene checkpoint protein 2, partial [Phenoliferia sp. Uapishka_3]